MLSGQQLERATAPQRNVSAGCVALHARRTQAGAAEAQPVCGAASKAPRLALKKKRASSSDRNSPCACAFCHLSATYDVRLPPAAISITAARAQRQAPLEATPPVRRHAQPA